MQFGVRGIAVRYKKILFMCVLCGWTQLMIASTGTVTVFVSLSMPNSSIQAWIEDANQYQATVVLRGLVNNSLKETIARMKSLFTEETLMGIRIDPNAFRRYNIEAVPAVVVDDASTNSYTVIYGDTSLASALKSLD